MAKVTIWYAKCLDDHDAYSIRERRKKDAVALRNTDPSNYGPVEKVVLYYKDAFDLVDKLLSEGGMESMRYANEMDDGED